MLGDRSGFKHRIRINGYIMLQIGAALRAEKTQAGIMLNAQGASRCVCAVPFLKDRVHLRGKISGVRCICCRELQQRVYSEKACDPKKAFETTA